MSALPSIDHLPRENASRVKNQWADVVREVQAKGSVAVTKHARVELVLLTPDAYTALLHDAQAAQQQAQAQLEALNARFDAQLHRLQAPQASQALTDLFAAQGQLDAAHRPVAGGGF
ncbi:hypothetical protein CCO03_10375 [Comamonas serinivorans]|uniref:Antitoxin n=1 Tax=Comamonas serinivorans TaxID=1082851 RepID=A0A1Y0EN59_9BURK|nr:hypothetical protein [Comamonas serinivorans]ARU05037.1 hypothetical protein CCO03_10375 [Comamonas serinivorans]